MFSSFFFSLKYIINDKYRREDDGSLFVSYRLARLGSVHVISLLSNVSCWLSH